MPDEPQNATAEGPRDARTGQIRPGHTLNPGGQPAWLKDVLRRLEAGSSVAADYLCRVVAGSEKSYALTKEGVEVEVQLAHRDRIAASKVILEYTVPKPKAADDSPEEARARTALAERILARLAGLDS